MSRWTPNEDATLLAHVRACGPVHWHVASTKIATRNQTQCLHRWIKVLRPGIVKGSWSEVEDTALTLLHMKNVANTRIWSVISKGLGGARTGKQCRERWINHLCVKKKPWSAKDVQTLMSLHDELGPAWADIARRMCRTENGVKNQFVIVSGTRRRRHLREMSLWQQLRRRQTMWVH